MPLEEPFTPAFFKRLQRLKICTRRAFLGSRQGGHMSLRRGHGLEFADFRLYAPGDDFRHIDWNAYGKTDRLYVRQFREEQDINVIFLIDTSASMKYPEGEKKFELAINLALSLGYVALADGDTVTFSLLGQKNTPRFRGAKSFSKALKELRGTQPTDSFIMLDEVRAATAMHRIPGKCFFISDFLFEEDIQFTTLDYLRSRNFEISVFQILSPSELSLSLENETTMVIDSESTEQLSLSLGAGSRKEYAKLLAKHVESLERDCFSAAIPHVLISSKESTDEIVLERFPQTGILK